jgi:calcipressin
LLHHVLTFSQKLENPDIFAPDNLQTLRQTIEQYGAIHTWSPFKSFSRIIIVFYDVSVAKLIKETLDNEIIMDCQVRVYFANHTNLSPTARHLAAPKLDKMFFISPPPSPPHDWEMRNEEPPNKTVHADDLATALAKLHARGHTNPDDMDIDQPENNRARSSSVTVVYHPNQHGSNPNLPAISVEDTSEIVESPADEQCSMEGIVKEPILHTSRPPVELMEQ